MKYLKLALLWAFFVSAAVSTQPSFAVASDTPPPVPSFTVGSEYQRQADPAGNHKTNAEGTHHKDAKHRKNDGKHNKHNKKDGKHNKHGKHGKGGKHNHRDWNKCA